MVITDEKTPSPASPPQRDDLGSMLAAAAQTANGLRLSSEHCTQRLGEIEEQLEEAASLEGMRVLRFRLGECLQRLREQALSQREKMTGLLAQLQEQIEILQAAERIHPPLALDALTGLEGRPSAERAVAAAIEQGGPLYAALSVVDGLHVINARYGYSTGDQMLRRVRDHLASCLAPTDRLFRWTGPAFLALLERPEDLLEIQKEIKTITSVKLELAVQIGHGSVLLGLPLMSLLLPLSGLSGLSAVSARVDGFIGQQARH
jgi:GGDEF domain-containing protein